METVIDEDNNQIHTFHLTVHHVSVDDSGTFGCNAWNSLGMGTTTAQLRVFHVLPPAAEESSSAALMPASMVSDNTSSSTSGQYCRNCLHNNHTEDQCWGGVKCARWLVSISCITVYFKTNNIFKWWYRSQGNQLPESSNGLSNLRKK